MKKKYNVRLNSERVLGTLLRTLVACLAMGSIGLLIKYLSDAMLPQSFAAHCLRIVLITPVALLSFAWAAKRCRIPEYDWLLSKIQRRRAAKACNTPIEYSLLAHPSARHRLCDDFSHPSLRRKIMSATDDKTRGTANDAVGNVKQAVGNVTGNEDMQAEGAAQETKGDAQKALGNAKDAVGNVAKNIGNAIKGSGS
jgi:uncharacterized protein YjbJ (UPF0337 family)